MKIICIGLLLLILTGFSIENKKKIVDTSGDLILWNSERKLAWDDFQGIPQTSSRYKAITSSIIEMNPTNFNDSIIEYEFQCCFEKEKSWVKEKTITLLKHEQLHFDIAELSTRKMRQKFSKILFWDIKKVKEQIKELFQMGLEERNKFNKEYDTETNHGLIRDKQKEWEEKIAKELKALDKFSETKVSIKRMTK